MERYNGLLGNALEIAGGHDTRGPQDPDVLLPENEKPDSSGFQVLRPTWAPPRVQGRTTDAEGRPCWGAESDRELLYSPGPGNADRSPLESCPRPRRGRLQGLPPLLGRGQLLLPLADRMPPPRPVFRAGGDVSRRKVSCRRQGDHRTSPRSRMAPRLTLPSSVRAGSPAGWRRSGASVQCGVSGLPVSAAAGALVRTPGSWRG